jgi:N-sulfoglucosamine sulfohydrolase
LRAEGKLTPVQAVLVAPTMPAEELYDLERDPHETVNLVASPEHRATLERLRAALTTWIDGTNDQGKTLEPAALATARGATKPGSNPNATAIVKRQ